MGEKMTPDEWLVREKGRLIRGPFPAEKLRKMIVDGNLVAQSEICVANGYWVGLHETEEVERLLGIRIPMQLGRVETHFHEDKTDSLDPVQLQSLEKETAPETTALLIRAGERLTVAHTNSPIVTPVVSEKKDHSIFIILVLLLIAVGVLAGLYYLRAMN
jgi:hypothetical protein